jgi:hypothetical protein
MITILKRHTQAGRGRWLSDGLAILKLYCEYIGTTSVGPPEHWQEAQPETPSCHHDRLLTSRRRDSMIISSSAHWQAAVDEGPKPRARVVRVGRAVKCGEKSRESDSESDATRRQHWQIG